MASSNILVVDDDPLVRKVLKKYLASHDYYVDTAEDGSGALDMLKTFSYDLVLTDLQMPRLGGRELLEVMSNEYSHIPKIVLTGHGTNDDIIAAMKAGAYDFLYKPIEDFDILLYSVLRAVESKKLREDKDRHLSELEKINEIISMLNSGKSTDQIFNMLNVSLKKVIPFDGTVLALLNETNTFINIENVLFNQGHYFNIIRKGDRLLASQFNLSQLMDEEKGVANTTDLGVYIRNYEVNDLIKDLFRNGINSMLAVSLFIGTQVRGVLFFLSSQRNAFKDHHITFVKSIAGQISLSIQRAELMKEIESHSKSLENTVADRTEEIKKTQRTTIFALSMLADARDSETGDHLERIRNYSVALMTMYKEKAGHFEINDRILDDLYDSSVLHDVGKVGIPDHILLKKGRLTEDEFEVMKTHTVIGYDALKKASQDLGSDSFLNMAIDIVLFHHERWDGLGYPKGIKGEEIPLSARVVAIVDVYDALTSTRPYKEAYSHEESIEIMKNETGKFDPVLFNLFLDNSDEFNNIRLQFSNNN